MQYSKLKKYYQIQKMNKDIKRTLNNCIFNNMIFKINKIKYNCDDEFIIIKFSLTDSSNKQYMGFFKLTLTGLTLNSLEFMIAKNYQLTVNTIGFELINIAKEYLGYLIEINPIETNEEMKIK
ncbi:hypothetical protein ACWCL1_08200 [Ligilactobacillus sp. LYQ135]